MTILEKCCYVICNGCFTQVSKLWPVGHLFTFIETTSARLSESEILSLPYININEDNNEMPQPRSTAFPRNQKNEKSGTNKDKNKRHIRNHRQTTKGELHQRNRLGVISRKTTWWGGGGGGGGGLKPVLPARNLTSNSDAAPNYKYICHYENTPIQIYRKIYLQNLKLFR